MTIRINMWPWNRKRETELRYLREMEEKREACNTVACEPCRPPHPCEQQGHLYRPIAQVRAHVVLFCERCAEVQRVSLKLPVPPPQSRWQHENHAPGARLV